MKLLLLLGLLWILIHAAHHVLTPSELLPMSRRRPKTQIILKKLHLRVLTFALNATHDKLVKTISRRTRLRAFLAGFYNLGCAAGSLGVILALGLLVWNCAQTLHPLLQRTWSQPIDLIKRGLELSGETRTRSNVIQPLIPGWTVPLGHLPVILAAVFLCQIIHELGHAVSAALDTVPIMSAGASVTVIVPAAFVSFPTAALDALRPLARARIIAAGPFHNLAFWGLLLLVDFLGTSDVLTRILYRDVSDVGRVALEIDADSDLYGYLPVGALITHLDDTPLGGPADRWTAYLTLPPAASALGWCVDRARFLASPHSCCVAHAPLENLSCFVAASQERGCLEAVAILTSQATQRCTTDAGCPDAAWSCVRPDASAQILRLTVRVEEREEQVILWSGPRAEVLEQVRLGTFVPRTRLSPLWLWTSVQSLWMYLKTATLSLYLFNLLPLPYLDGTQFVQTLLDVLFDSVAQTEFDQYDIDALEAATRENGGTSRRERNRGRWKARVGRGITVATTSLFVLSGFLTLANIR